MSKSVKQSQRGGFRMQRTTVVFLVVLAMVTVSCTPAQVESVFNQLDTPFEAGYDLQSLEAGLFQAGLVLSFFIPGLGLGPGLF